MLKIKTILMFFLSLLLSTGVHSGEKGNCPPKYYQEDLNELVTINVVYPFFSENSDYNYDARLDIIPTIGYQGLEFYGGAIQHGYPEGVLSGMNFIDHNDQIYSWILINLNSMDSIKIRLWFSNEECHMAAVFMLNEMVKKESFNANNKP